MLLEKYDIEEMQNRQADESSLIVTTDNARKALMTKLNRSGVSFSGRSAKRVVQRGVMARGNSFAGVRFGQRVIVKIRYVKHKAKFGAKVVAGLSVGGVSGAGGGSVGRASAGGGASALRSHVNYISRGDAGKEGEQAVLFDVSGQEVDKGDFVALCQADRHHWRFIISPENGHQIEDFQGYVRGIMGKVESDLGTKLEWVSAVHYDTDDIHAHVIVRGRNDREQDLVIGQDYIKEGIRRRAQELATELLGERSLEEVQKSLEAEVDALRVTSLDRFIERQASKERIVDVRKRNNFDKSMFYEGLIKGRLRYLASAGLAEEKPPGVFTLKEGYKEALAQAAEKNNAMKLLYKKDIGARLDNLSVYSMRAGKGREIEGRILDKGLHDELTESKYIVVKDMDEKLHYVPVGAWKGYEQLETGSLIKIAPGGQSTGKADHNIAREAGKNNGIYDPEKHLVAILRYIPEADCPRYLEGHQIRLATLEKKGIVKPLGEGRYEIPKDVVERGVEINREINAKEKKRFYPKLEVLSARPLEELIDAEKRTWLDKELVYQQAKGKSSLSITDAVLQQVLEARKVWLVEHDIGKINSNGRFALRENALRELDRMEVLDAGRTLAGKLDFEFREYQVKPDVSMRYEGYVDLESGRWEVVTKGKSLQLAYVEVAPDIEPGTRVVFRALENGELGMEPVERAREKEQEKPRDKGRDDDTEMEL